MRIALILNTAERAELTRLRERVEGLRREGHEVRPRLTFEAGDGERMAREAAEWGAELVVAAGGDGTVNEVANGIHAHRAAHPGSDILPRLGIVPLGTGNDLASALQIPAEVEAAMEIAVSGGTRFVDVARVAGRCFLNVSTGGIGAEATEEASPEVKRVLGRVAYMITGARKFVGLHPSSARFTAGEVVHDGPFLLFAVGNSRLTGGGNLLTPRAEMDDGLLDLCVVREVSRMEFAKLLPLLRTGEHLDHPAVLYRQVPRVTVEPRDELSVNADGEPILGCQKLEYGLSPHRLALTVP